MQVLVCRKVFLSLKPSETTGQNVAGLPVYDTVYYQLQGRKERI